MVLHLRPSFFLVTWSKITYDSCFDPAGRSITMAFSSYLLFSAYSCRYEFHDSNGQSFQNVGQYSFHVRIRIMILHFLPLKALLHIFHHKTYPNLVILSRSDSLLKSANRNKRDCNMQMSFIQILQKQDRTFLDAFSHLYKRVCPSVCPSDYWSISPSVRHT